ncbi:hypothetical protein [Vagococcus lutrae]|uniref:hypothetical protein n=1 Tax=Vagococcus lutrae TaxID=81947 RepID=UPI0028919292|nr:hypothetical protein [Vagococcus lutrae]MDT2842644.1 hypothetical protein [Vagococcus lutrae]
MDRKYLWKKKQEYVSKVESADCMYLYRGKESIFLFCKFKNLTMNDELHKYLFTEKEANEILGNTFYMFERIEIDVQDDTAL